MPKDTKPASRSLARSSSISGPAGPSGSGARWPGARRRLPLSADSGTQAGLSVIDGRQVSYVREPVRGEDLAMRMTYAILMRGRDEPPSETSPELHLHAFRETFEARPVRRCRDPEGSHMTDVTKILGPGLARRPLWPRSARSTWTDGSGLSLPQLPTQLAKWRAALEPDAGDVVEAQDAQ